MSGQIPYNGDVDNEYVYTVVLSDDDEVVFEDDDDNVLFVCETNLGSGIEDQG